MSVLAWNVATAMSRDWPVVATLRTRPVRKVRGLVTMRRIDKRRKMTGRDGESNLLITIGGEEIPLEQIASLARARQEPSA